MYRGEIDELQRLCVIIAGYIDVSARDLGQNLVLITGGIDLSVTSTIAMASVTGAMVMGGEEGILMGSAIATPAAIIGMMITGAVIGSINGAVVSLLRMPPFIVTLTAMMFFSGFAVWMTQSQSIFNLPDSFLAIGQQMRFAIPLTVLVALLAEGMLSRTLIGKWFYAIGHNREAARISGVPTAGVIFFAYVLSGVCAALASVLYTGRLETGSPVLGRNLLLDIVGATVIGGTSLYGGKGKVIWTVFGVLLLTLIDNSLNLLGLSYFTIMMVKGGVILLAAVLDSLRNRLKRA
jgi:ribose/xylose/arabinose/galactoside ABC-type transport system permease subunit